jgi:Transposase DDE domain group 1
VNRRYFRGDAAFASPEIYEFLEAEDFGYAIRLPTNHVLHSKIENLLQRPRVDHHLRCAATMPASLSIRSWSKPRRAVAKVEWHPSELCPRVDLIVTNLARPAERIVGFYNHRGTSEHGSKRTRARSSGPGCYAAPSLPTRCAFSPCPSRTIWGI